MLRINEDFLIVPTAQGRSRFEEELNDHVAQTRPELGWPPGNPALGQRVHEAIERGLALGLTTQSACAAYVDLSFEFGDAFETQPRFARVADVLRRPDLDPDAKIRRAEAHLYRSI